MSYKNFLTLINQNTNNQFDDYKWLCRFCLQNESHGIDLISEKNDCYETKQQRDVLFDNFHIITKTFLPISPEYPNFVCSSCESNLIQNATFIRQIERNAENWEIFLKTYKDANVQMNYQPMTTIAFEEIKIEKSEDDSLVKFSEANIYDIFDTSVSNDENTMSTVHIQIESPSHCQQGILNENFIKGSSGKRRKVTESEPKNLNLTTDYDRTCKLCNEPTFSSLKHYYKHLLQQHPGAKTFTCDICSTQFSWKERMFTHMKDRHSEFGKKHQCQYCAQLFFSDREVKGHEKIHLNTRSYICILCGKGFNQKTILNRHLQSKAHNAEYKTLPKKKVYKYTKHPRKQIYRCELCTPQIVFSTPEERATHKTETHRTYECDICKNSFMAQESLDSHKSRHSKKPRNFVCTVCNATFSQSSHLSSHHKRKHTNDRSFQCPQCDKAFFEGYILTAHENLVHKKQERVKCSECPSTFATNKYLQSHILHQHSPDVTRYDCKICGKKCTNGVKLDEHRVKFH